MLEGTVIENSLVDPDCLKNYEILKSWDAGNWKLHKLRLSEMQAVEFSDQLIDGPWYVHFWKENQNDVLVVFKNKEFWIKFDDKVTWENAVEYGLSLNIPPEQLNFLIDQ